MVPADRLLPFAAAAFVLIAVPGPSVLFVVSRALALGRRAALATVLGNAFGVYLQVVAVALGIGAVVERSAGAFTAVKLLGAAYLMLLGLRTFRHRHRLAAVVEVATARRSTRRILREGVVVGVLNPKAIVFFAAVLPQFADPERGAVPVQLLVLGLVFVAIALVCDSAWGLAAGTARSWFVGSPRRLAAIGGASGLAVVGLGARLAVSGKAD
jgi:threonine/homoserine/homoserine lactone efflux protein